MNFIPIKEILADYGPMVAYCLLFAVIFAESGLFFGFFLPGDSLLLTAGLLAYQGVGGVKLSLFVLIPLLFAAAVLGDNVGYWFGRKVGPPLFKRPQSLLFRPKNLLAAKAFYDKHGGKTITIARFMPFIRTFAPIVAGAVGMHWRRFMFFNLFGGLLWAIGLTCVGYLLGWLGGQLVSPEEFERYFLILIFVVIIVSMMPALIHLWRTERHEIFAWIKTKILRRPAAGTATPQPAADDPLPEVAVADPKDNDPAAKNGQP
jgi:membrane-associated protein